MAPEELIMVVDRGSVCIRNVVTKGPPVHEVNVPPSSLYSAIYSKVFDRLVIMSCSGNYFTTLDVKTGAPYTITSSGEPLCPIAFSRTAKQLVCGGETSGLETVDISTGRRIHFDFPATVTSISTLLNGTISANIPISGIQRISKTVRALWASVLLCQSYSRQRHRHTPLAHRVTQRVPQRDSSSVISSVLLWNCHAGRLSVL